MVDDVVVVVAAMPDLAAADAAFERLVSEGRAGIDAVTIGRSLSGEVRFDRETVMGRGSKCSLAAGLVAALYPSVGADLPVSLATERAVLNAVAGRVGLAVGRTGLLELGEHLDAAGAALIVAAPAGVREEILGIIDDAERLLVRLLALDREGIEHVAQAARRAVRLPPVDR